MTGIGWEADIAGISVCVQFGPFPAIPKPGRSAKGTADRTAFIGDPAELQGPTVFAVELSPTASGAAIERTARVLREADGSRERCWDGSTAQRWRAHCR